jgi:hypothetical protein
MCGGRDGTRPDFIQVLSFNLPVLVPSNAPYSSSGAGKICLLVADVPSGVSRTPLHPTKQKKILPYCVKVLLLSTRRVNICACIQKLCAVYMIPGTMFLADRSEQLAPVTPCFHLSRKRKGRTEQDNDRDSRCG